MRKLLTGLMAAWFFCLSTAAVAGSGSKAINFQFTDINGKSVQLSDLKGKWVLVNFWAPWCPLCWVEVPALNDLNKRKDFAVIGIGLDYGPDENVVRDAAQRHDFAFYAVVAGGARRNPDSPFRQVGPVDFYPTSYLYDPDGEIVMFIPGQLKSSKVLAFMEAWGAKKNIRFASTEGHPAAEAAASAPAVKEVTYTKQTAMPKAAIKRSPTKRNKKSVTY